MNGIVNLRRVLGSGIQHPASGKSTPLSSRPQLKLGEGEFWGGLQGKIPRLALSL
jgi:hypothetical protein